MFSSARDEGQREDDLAVAAAAARVRRESESYIPVSFMHTYIKIDTRQRDRKTDR
jgi:hypothetical protein